MSINDTKRTLRLALVAINLSLGGMALRAMDEPAAPAGTYLSVWTLTSGLASSPEARAYIQTRIDQWEREKASLLLLARGGIEHQIGKLDQARMDLAGLHRRYSARAWSEEEVISDRDYEFLMKCDQSRTIGNLDHYLPQLDEGIVADRRESLAQLDFIAGCTCDDVQHVDFGDGERPAYHAGSPGVKAVLAPDPWKASPNSLFSQHQFYLRNITETGLALNEIDEFLREWLQWKALQLKADAWFLEANQATPWRLVEAEATVPERKDAAAAPAAPPARPATAAVAPPAKPVAETAEPAAKPVAETAEPAASAEPVAPARPATAAAGDPGSPLIAAAPGGRSRAFDPWYHFVDSSRWPRTVAAEFQVGKAVARIRAAVDARSMHLASAEVVRLVEALEPYGARCASDRKKGIMIKLPAADAVKRFVPVFIHRTHASHDTMDINTVEALKAAFDASIFALEKFPGQ